MSTDNFNFDLQSDFKGYNSSRDRTNLDGAFLIRGSKNVYKKLSGTIASRPGLLRRGSADTTTEGVKSSYEWYTSLGETHPLRVCNNKLQVESNLSGSYVWYDLLETSTLLSPAVTYTRFVFDAWWDNTEKKDRVLMVRGDDKILHWSGGITKIASGTVNTITKSDTTTTWAQDGFATNTGGEKKIVISGVEYTYTGGETTSTLTGVTPDASALVADSIAVQSVIATDNKPADGFLNDFIKVIGNRLHCGSYTSRLVYISDDGDFTDYTVPSPRVPGSPELLTLDNTTNGITSRNGNAHISAGFSDWYEIIYTDITVSTTLTQQTKVDKKPTAFLQAAYAHEFIDTVGNDIVYLSKDQQLRVLGTFRNLFQAKYPCLSQAVYNELAEDDFIGGHLRAIGDFIYITAPNNGRDWMHQTRESVDAQGNVTAERLWHPPQIRNISRFAVIDGVVFGHSNANPQIYQVWDTGQWHDDSPSDEPLPYDCYMKMAYRHQNDKSGARRQGLISFDKAYFEGYIATGVELNANILCDYQGSTSLQQTNINSISSPVTFFISSSELALGTASLGTTPLGDGIIADDNDQELLAKFRAICGVNPADCFEYSLEVFSSDPDSRWEIISLGVNPLPAEFSSTFIRK
jgi:hypothetical protein